MYKTHKRTIPPQISNVFISNNSHHNLHEQIEKNESTFKLFRFHGINIRNHISRKIPIDVSYVCYKILFKKYLQSNIIPYNM